MKTAEAQMSSKAAKPRVAPWLVAVIIAVVSGGLIWFVVDNVGHWKDRFVPRKLRTIDAESIYASGQIDRHLIRQVLVDHHIRTIVCLSADDPDDPDAVAEKEIAGELGIERFVDPLSGDGTGDIQSYADAITQIVQAQRQGRVVLVHCTSGVQRSGGATFFYRVLIEHWDADAAVQEMIHNGFKTRSNSTLIPYLNSHISEAAALLAQRGVIDHIPSPLPQIHHE